MTDPEADNGAHLPKWKVDEAAWCEKGLRLSGSVAARDSAADITITGLNHGAAIARAHVSAGEAATFSLLIPIESFRPPIVGDISVLVEEGGGQGTALRLEGMAKRLAEAKIQTERDFLRLCQSPSERLTDPGTLFYLSLHTAERMPEESGVLGAAVCVMGYRVLEGLDTGPDVRSRLDRLIESSLGQAPQSNRGVWLRWHTSVRLVAGYLAYCEGRQDAAAEHFGIAADFAFELTAWPSSLTNILTGVFLSGYVHLQNGNNEKAASVWRRAEGVFRYGAAVANLSNFYAYGELSNALRVANECFVGLQQATTGAPIASISVGPLGRGVDLNNLPGIRHNLQLAEKRRPREGAGP